MILGPDGKPAEQSLANPARMRQTIGFMPQYVPAEPGPPLPDVVTFNEMRGQQRGRWLDGDGEWSDAWRREPWGKR